MTIKVAINGFGRIGRLVLRQIQAQHADDIEVVAVNRSRMRPINQIVYLLKYDTTQGPFPGTFPGRPGRDHRGISSPVR